MEEREVLEAIAPFADARRAVAVGDGWGSDTFLVDDRFIVRFPKRDEVADALRREIDLLPRLNVTFSVPRFDWIGEHRGRPFVGYEAIDGSGLTVEDLEGRPALANDVGNALAELHACEVEPYEDWHDRYRALRERVLEDVVPHLEIVVATGLVEAFDRYLSRTTFEPVLVHNDLGTEHVLIRDGELAGIIDFEDATVGDPLIDLVGFDIDLGRPWTERIARAAGITIDEERLRFYVAMGAAHAVIYGLETNDAELVRDAATNVGTRLYH